MITTHYIEEARKANRVGLMRSGRILAEDEPNHLLNQYNETVCLEFYSKLIQLTHIVF
ncbi:unnamed protein product, partial [Rotaria sordida]